jgi:hypothetical protein
MKRLGVLIWVPSSQLMRLATPLYMKATFNFGWFMADELKLLRLLFVSNVEDHRSLATPHRTPRQWAHQPSLSASQH